MNLPRATAKTTVTIYNYLKRPTNDNEEGRFFYKRTVLTDCIWQQDSYEHFKNTGTPSLDAVKLLIPFSSEYASTMDDEEWPGNGWTIQMGPELMGTYIVKGECDFDFPDEEVEDYFHKYVMAFEREISYRRPNEVIEHFVGSRNMWYLEVRC